VVAHDGDIRERRLIDGGIGTRTVNDKDIVEGGACFGTGAIVRPMVLVVSKV